MSKRAGVGSAPFKPLAGGPIHTMTGSGIVAPGAGYDLGDSIVAAGGIAATRSILSVATLLYSTFPLDNAGAGYAPGNALNVLTSPAVGHIAVDTVGVTGNILTWHKTGNAISATPITGPVAVSGGAGTGATFTPGTPQVNSLSIDEPGAYYTPPTNPIAQLSTDGSGTGIQIEATFS